MTVEQDNTDEAFRGLMRGLNLDARQFKTYNFALLEYDELVAAKREIERQLELLFAVLRNTYGATMDTPLVVNGYPRADIDVVGVRLVRVKIIRVRNDLKHLMQLLEDKLVERFRAGEALPFPQAALALVSAPTTVARRAFATVGTVADDSPAFQSGLRPGDRVVAFGDVDAATPDKLARVAVATRNHLNRRLEVAVERGGHTLTLHLTPTDQWGGRGVLGCQLTMDAT